MFVNMSLTKRKVVIMETKIVESKSYKNLIMKKGCIYIFMLLIIFASGCSGKIEAVQETSNPVTVEEVETLINQLETPCTSTEIDEVKSKYNELPDSLKPQVSNYDRLVRCEKYRELCDAEFDHDMALREEFEATLQSYASNPYSVQILRFKFSFIHYDKDTEVPTTARVCAEYMEENSFGGTYRGERWINFFYVQGSWRSDRPDGVKTYSELVEESVQLSDLLEKYKVDSLN